MDVFQNESLHLASSPSFKAPAKYNHGLFPLNELYSGDPLVEESKISTVSKREANNSRFMGECSPDMLSNILQRPLQLSDVEHLSDTQLEKFYDQMLSNSRFQISAENKFDVNQMLAIAANRPKELKNFGFGQKRNTKLTENCTNIKIQNEDKFKIFFKTDKKFMRLSKLLIHYTPGITAASKFDSRLKMSLIDGRMEKKHEVIRETEGNLLFSSVTFMDADHFVPRDEFQLIYLRIEIAGTGLRKGHSWGSVWLYMEIESTDSPTQNPITTVRLVPTIPLSSLMTKGDHDPTKYNGFMTKEAMKNMSDTCRMVGTLKATRMGYDDPYDGFSQRSHNDVLFMDGDQGRSINWDEERKEFGSLEEMRKRSLSHLGEAKQMLGSVIKLMDNPNKDHPPKYVLDDIRIKLSEQQEEHKRLTKEFLRKHGSIATTDSEIDHALSVLEKNRLNNPTGKLYNCSCPSCTEANHKFSALNDSKPLKPMPPLSP